MAYNRLLNRNNILKTIVLITILGSISIVSGCMKSMTQKIKVTVSVQDGSQIYSGSAVQKFRCTETNNRWQGMAIGGCKIRGEAVTVKIGDKGYLFMIFSGSQGQGTNPEYYTGAIQNNRSQSGNTKWNVSLENSPMLVTFHDLNDPKSIIEVSPTSLSDVFGAGVTLQSIQIERTNEWVTFGQVEKILPWLKKIGYEFLVDFGGTAGGGSSGSSIPIETLQKSNFIWR